MQHPLCNPPLIARTSGSLRKQAGPIAACSARGGAMPQPTKKLLLLVDDDQNQLALRQALLESSGYEALTANHSLDALRLFVAHEIATVILDYQMPEMNGEAIAIWMKEEKPEVPLLMISGCAVPESVLRHVDGFMPKASQSTFLLQMIERLLQGFEKRKPQQVRIRERWKKTAGSGAG